VVSFSGSIALMAVSCSICSKGEESAGVVNEMLFKKSTLDEIAAATGFHRSSIDRHKKGDCTFSFPSYRAARVASKNKALTVENCRVIVAWPGNTPGFAAGSGEKSETLPHWPKVRASKPKRNINSAASQKLST
jgi:hypothetical protein